MWISRLALPMIALVATALAAGAVYGQTYPNKTIRIVTSGIGGGIDFVARVLAQGLTETLGQPVIVDNRTTSVVPGQVVSQAAPDGYTLLHYANTLWVGPLLQQTPYDPVRDFVPIILASKAPNILAVHPTLPVKSVKELIALARARPGELTFSVGGQGGASHLSGELFKVLAHVKVVLVPYKSGAQETADLVGGHVQATFGSAGQISPQIKAGKMRGFAVTTAQRSTLFPDYPTMAESGLPGFEYVNMTGTLAPAKTPEAIVNRLNQEIARVLERPDAKERFSSAGVERAGGSPDQFAAVMKADTARWAKLIKEAGIRGE